MGILKSIVFCKSLLCFIVKGDLTTMMILSYCSDSNDKDKTSEPTKPDAPNINADFFLFST